MAAFIRLEYGEGSDCLSVALLFQGLNCGFGETHCVGVAAGLLIALKVHEPYIFLSDICGPLLFKATEINSEGVAVVGKQIIMATDTKIHLSCKYLSRDRLS